MFRPVAARVLLLEWLAGVLVRLGLGDSRIAGYLAHRCIFISNYEGCSWHSINPLKDYSIKWPIQTPLHRVGCLIQPPLLQPARNW